MEARIPSGLLSCLPPSPDFDLLSVFRTRGRPTISHQWRVGYTGLEACDVSELDIFGSSKDEIYTEQLIPSAPTKKGGCRHGPDGRERPLAPTRARRIRLDHLQLSTFSIPLVQARWLSLQPLGDFPLHVRKRHCLPTRSPRLTFQCKPYVTSLIVECYKCLNRMPRGRTPPQEAAISSWTATIGIKWAPAALHQTHHQLCNHQPV
ncbi:hypothetical protein CDEST_06446 [Colletotrichum destructivum]|uniref:Uncharacterized protein n=1 Tax=Colletotrichum destructivum TaxID=34406 RepID=A0AAX4IDJ4_9PEZI|nr:hypothetical protein CDEST_06446 [Colletotrichum destructivum]